MKNIEDLLFKIMLAGIISLGVATAVSSDLKNTITLEKVTVIGHSVSLAKK